MFIIVFLLIHAGLPCHLGQYYDSTLNYCLSCLNGCQNCTIALSCSTCSPSFYKVASSCQACPSCCSTCVDAVNCTSCNNGFYLDSSSATCHLCSTNCINCTSNKCKKCNPGFYPNEKDCILCEVSCDCSNGYLTNCPSNLGQMLKVIIITPILVFFSIILIYCIISKKCKKNQQNPVQNTTQNDEDNSKSLSYGLKLIGVMLNMKKKNWTFNQNGDKIDREDICSICLQKKVNLMTKCNHQFHMKCLYKWLQQNRTCPLCKSNCTKNFKKFCKFCHNFILFDSKIASKYNVSLFDVCSYCQNINESQITVI